jgi:hypothetical protein
VIYKFFDLKLVWVLAKISRWWKNYLANCAKPLNDTEFTDNIEPKGPTKNMSNRNRNNSQEDWSNIRFPWIKILIIVVLIFAVILGVLPVYNVWYEGMIGSAELKKAEQNRKIKVQEAQAEFDSSELLAQATVVKAEGDAKAKIALAKAEATAIIERAKGEAEGNKLIAASIDIDYQNYLWISSLKYGKSIIYVPTESNLPLLEAGKRPEDKVEVVKPVESKK